MTQLSHYFIRQTQRHSWFIALHNRDSKVVCCSHKNYRQVLYPLSTVLTLELCCHAFNNFVKMLANLLALCKGAECVTSKGADMLMLDCRLWLVYINPMILL